MNLKIEGDSFDVLPDLISKCKVFDMVLADPLYDLSDWDKHTLHEYFIELCPGVIIVFSPGMNPWVDGYDQKLYWIKPISTKNTSRKYSNFVEEIFVYGRYAWNTHLHWSNYTNVLTDKVDSLKHSQWRKPPSMIERFIEIHTNPGDWVLDPFAGSFVVHDICVKLGRNSVCIEKDVLNVNL